MFIHNEFMTPRYPTHNNIEKFKVFVPESNGSGSIGEVLSTPLIGTPLMSSTPTFISIGNFDSYTEAENLLKYIKSKFARVLLGILKKLNTMQYPLGLMCLCKILEIILTLIGHNQFQI